MLRSVKWTALINTKGLVTDLETRLGRELRSQAPGPETIRDQESQVRCPLSSVSPESLSTVRGR